MWHLRKPNHFVGELFHTLDDVQKYILKQVDGMSWQLDFIPVWEAAVSTKSPSDSQPEPKRGFGEFPIPMSQP